MGAENPSEIQHIKEGDVSRGGKTITQFLGERGLKGGVSLESQPAGSSSASAILVDKEGRKYQMGDIIAQGGMGAILDAKDSNIRRSVAMKVMLKAGESKEEEVLRFIEEAQITGQLEHPNIVPVHELGIDESDNVFYTMKFVKGTTLQTLFEKLLNKDEKCCQRFDLNALLNIFLKACDAVAFAHHRHVLHRDLKPENIMIGDYGEVLVLDWGLSKILTVDVQNKTEEDIEKEKERLRVISEMDVDSVRSDSETSSSLKTMDGAIMGTPKFMAPEQAKGKIEELDKRTDIYALGAILYQILTLRPPIDDENINQVLIKVIKGEIISPDQLTETDGAAFHHLPAEKVPTSLSHICMKALALKPENRYQHVGDLQDDIEKMAIKKKLKGYNTMKLTEHPRLYITPSHIASLKKPVKSKLKQYFSNSVKKLADNLLKNPELTYPRNRHNELLIRAREVQKNVLTLTVQFLKTKKPQYKKAAVSYIKMMHDWEYWSWIAWGDNNSGTDAIYDLSYGENSATLGIAFDLLYSHLTKKEKQLFIDTALRWSFKSWQKNALNASWFKKVDSNWNTVCAGGMGILALSMYDELPELAAKVIKQVETSIAPYFKTMTTLNGGWPEGVGYWNYGMRYAFMYVLSYENAYGKTHRLMRLKGTKETMHFPLDFTPAGLASGFGDANSWQPISFHYLCATRLKLNNLKNELLERLSKNPICNNYWPNSAEWLLTLDNNVKIKKRVKSKDITGKLYKNLDWAVLKSSRMFATIRGGTTNVPHGHCDLLSFNLVQGKEKIISNIGVSSYIDSTFSERRYDLFNIRADSKNTIFVNGVGIKQGTSLTKTEYLTINSRPVIRLDATKCYGVMRWENNPLFAGRLFVLVSDKLFLIIDHIHLTHVGLAETRMHTFLKLKKSDNGFLLASKNEQCNIVYTSNVPCIKAAAQTAPTMLTEEKANVLRYGTKAQCKDIVLVTALGATDKRLKLQLNTSRKYISLKIKHGNKTFQVKTDDRLCPVIKGK